MKKRPWVIASAFVWTLAGAVAIAAYSGQTPLVPAAPEHDHASHAGQPHVDEPASATAATAPASIPGLAPNRAAPKTGGNASSIVPREIKWEESFESAMKRASAQNKPILIDFYADWCSPCKEMDARVYPDRNVIAQSQNWVTVKVNGETRPDLMNAYGLRGYPSLVFAHGNGQPVKVTTAYLNAPQLVQQMQEAFSLWNSSSDRA